MSSAGILNLPITSLPVDNFHDRALWCKSIGINYNMHGWILCRYCATGWFWWISGLRAVTMWSSSSFTKTSMHQSITIMAMALWTVLPYRQLVYTYLGIKWIRGIGIVIMFAICIVLLSSFVKYHGVDMDNSTPPCAMLHICASKLCHQLFRQWLIINCHFGNNIQRNVNHNTIIFIQEYAIKTHPLLQPSVTFMDQLT